MARRFTGVVVIAMLTVFLTGCSCSGVVYKTEGIIVTNAHVVGKSKQAQVGFADRQRVDSTVIATDRVTDLALTRTERRNLPAATFVDSPGNSGGALVNSDGKIVLDVRRGGDTTQVNVTVGELPSR